MEESTQRRGVCNGKNIQRGQKEIRDKLIGLLKPEELESPRVYLAIIGISILVSILYKKGGEMSDQNLAELERQVAAQPDELGLRARLYVRLMRMGRASEKALRLSAYHKDPAAMLVVGDKVPNKGIERDEELALLKDLPLQTLDLRECGMISDEGLKHLKNMPLQRLHLESFQITDEGLRHLKDLPLQIFTMRYCEQITEEGLKHLKDCPIKFWGMGEFVYRGSFTRFLSS